MKYNSNTLVALIINKLVASQYYTEKELNGIRRFLLEYMEKEIIENIAEQLNIELEVEDE